ncbi:unnamed protein product [Dracunculus medinensis]|uniref:Nucleosome assembly protein 1-like 1 n=1 Tax=Dracunculus medinensis TaxID=318479 RepID=A0A0N4UH61_DRAME|nr:unnamed protein product [Dracunculus medinensis]
MDNNPVAKAANEAEHDDELNIQDYLRTLPKSVKSRVCALKKLQLEVINIESEFYNKIHELEMEFAPRFDSLYSKRKQIVTGEYEPSAEECDVPIIFGLPAETLNDESDPEPPEPIKGIPDFWLTLLKEVDNIGSMIQEHDEPILRHLIDICVELKSNPNEFSLFFHFKPNEYFEQTVLEKKYTIRMTPIENDPFSYDGPIVTKSLGFWKEGKNVTQTTIKKKQKKGNNAGKFISKVVKADSFFNFFDPVEINKDLGMGCELDDDEREMVEADFEIGQLFRDQVIPRAVLFYTGEIVDDGLLDQFEGEEDEDEVILNKI